MLHSFGAPPDGTSPDAGVIGRAGTFYGTTFKRGARTAAMVPVLFFLVTTGGTEKVLHSFGNADDGKYPAAGLV
ncbi:MAG: hypothetical protein WCB01_11380 [Candidatus Cybelea sp.]